MEDILHEGPDEEAGDSSEKHLGDSGRPGLYSPEEQGDEDYWKEDDVPPLDVREPLEETRLEHRGRRNEQPVGMVYYLHVFFTIEVPDLREERAIRVNYSGYLLLEGPDDHGVGHLEGERVMKLHLLVDPLKVLLPQEGSSSRVMRLEGRNVQDVVV